MLVRTLVGLEHGAQAQALRLPNFEGVANHRRDRRDVGLAGRAHDERPPAGKRDDGRDGWNVHALRGSIL